MASLRKKVSDRIRIAIAFPLTFFALGQSMSPPYPVNTRMQRLAEWVTTNVLPDDLE